MDHRKPIDCNRGERLALRTLTAAVEPWRCRVHEKMRVADVLRIDGGDLSEVESHYADQACFDFVVQPEGEEKAAFAVEFDERAHDADLDVIGHDVLKKAVCQKLEFEFVRIRSGALRAIRDGSYSLLHWLIEAWFTQRDIDAAIATGALPEDEPFGPEDLLSPSADGQLRWLDPFHDARRRFFEAEGPRTFSIVVRNDERGFVCGEATLYFEDGWRLQGHARVTPLDTFRGPMDSDIAGGLAVLDCLEHLRRFRAGDEGVLLPTAQEPQARLDAHAKGLRSVSSGPCIPRSRRRGGA